MCGISIHAPAWGATLATDEAREALEISIHAPAWGATNARQNHTRRSNISIHAPAWGATWAIFKWYEIPTFQSTRPRGARRQSLKLCDIFFLHFNPRARMGRDLFFYRIWYKLVHFNPRARMGRDNTSLVKRGESW